VYASINTFKQVKNVRTFALKFQTVAQIIPKNFSELV